MEAATRPGLRAGVLKRRAHCPICGHAGLRDRYSVNGFTITRCGDCSLVFVREIVMPELLADYYASSAGDQVYSDPENESNLNFYDLRLKESIEKFIAAGRILDVGCDRGRFLDVLTGWERHGIELSPALAEIAKRTHGARIHQGTLDDYDSGGVPFDAITVLDTLDHMSEPGPVLDRCRDLLRPEGLLVVKVHNIDCLYARISGSRFYAISPPSHLYYFSPRSLARLLESHGFRTAAIRFFPHRLSIKNVFYRLAKGVESHPAHRVYAALAPTRIGRWTIRKNLHDIVTVFARKR